EEDVSIRRQGPSQTLVRKNSKSFICRPKVVTLRCRQVCPFLRRPRQGGTMGSRNLSRYILVVVCSVLLLSSAAQPAFSWGDDGHELVARIAARNLTAKARQGIVDLMRRASVDDLKLRDLVGKLNDPQPSDDAVEEALSRIAIWPDHMPGGKGITQPWHFIDIALFEGPTHMDENCEAGCVNQLITEIVKNLPTKPLTSKFAPNKTFPTDREFRFLVHFVGDMHQPLHSATDADAGGELCPRVRF